MDSKTIKIFVHTELFTTNNCYKSDLKESVLRSSIQSFLKSSNFNYKISNKNKSFFIPRSELKTFKIIPFYGF